MDFNEACIMWRLIHHPTSATIDDIMKLVFNSTYDHRKHRYFSNTPGALLQESAIPSSNKDADDNSTTPYENIKLILRNSNIDRTRQPVALSEDFEALPESPISFDRTPSIQIAEDEIIPCPDTVEEALFLVSKARQRTATHPSFTNDRITKSVDRNGFDIYNIHQSVRGDSTL